MHALISVCVVLPLAALFLLACGDECQEPPGEFEVVAGCVVELEAGEDVYPFCTNRPSGPSGRECGGPDEPFAQTWLADMQALVGPGSPNFPTRVGCGPFNPELVVQANDDDCCFLLVYAGVGEETCVDHSFLAQ